MSGFRFRTASLVLAAFVLAGCSTVAPKTDLKRLYATQAGNPDQPPVVIVHGALGSRLWDPVTGEEIEGFTQRAWPRNNHARRIASHFFLALLRGALRTAATTASTIC